MSKIESTDYLFHMPYEIVSYGCNAVHKALPERETLIEKAEQWGKRQPRNWWTIATPLKYFDIASILFARSVYFSLDLSRAKTIAMKFFIAKPFIDDSEFTQRTIEQSLREEMRLSSGNKRGIKGGIPPKSFTEAKTFLDNAILKELQYDPLSSSLLQSTSCWATKISAVLFGSYAAAPTLSGFLLKSSPISQLLSTTPTLYNIVSQPQYIASFVAFVALYAHTAFLTRKMEKAFNTDTPSIKYYDVKTADITSALKNTWKKYRSKSIENPELISYLQDQFETKAKAKSSLSNPFANLSTKEEETPSGDTTAGREGQNTSIASNRPSLLDLPFHLPFYVLSGAFKTMRFVLPKKETLLQQATKLGQQKPLDLPTVLYPFKYLHTASILMARSFYFFFAQEEAQKMRIEHSLIGNHSEGFTIPVIHLLGKASGIKIKTNAEAKRYLDKEVLETLNANHSSSSFLRSTCYWATKISVVALASYATAPSFSGFWIKHLMHSQLNATFPAAHNFISNPISVARAITAISLYIHTGLLTPGIAKKLETWTPPKRLYNLKNASFTPAIEKTWNRYRKTEDEELSEIPKEYSKRLFENKRETLTPLFNPFSDSKNIPKPSQKAEEDAEVVSEFTMEDNFQLSSNSDDQAIAEGLLNSAQRKKRKQPPSINSATSFDQIFSPPGSDDESEIQKSENSHLVSAPATRQKVTRTRNPFQKNSDAQFTSSSSSSVPDAPPPPSEEQMRKRRNPTTATSSSANQAQTPAASTFGTGSNPTSTSIKKTPMSMFQNMGSSTMGKVSAALFARRAATHEDSSDEE